MSDDWTPRNPKWWSEQDPFVAVEAAKGYYLLKFLKWGLILLVTLGPVFLCARLIAVEITEVQETSPPP